MQTDPQPVESLPDPATVSELMRMRGSLDNLDAALVHLLAERFEVTERIGALKADHGLPPADPAREHRQAVRLRRVARTAGLDPAFVGKVLALITSEVVSRHAAIADRR